MTPYYQDSAVTIYHGDCREILPSVVADVLITDPPYGVNFSGKKTKHTKDTTGGYTTGDSDIGICVVSEILPHVKRAAVFPGTRLLHQYPRPSDIGCIFCPAGAGIGKWGFIMFHPILFYGQRKDSVLCPTSLQSFANSVGECDHPCPKPLKWLTWLVSLASLPEETVLDPFTGSGTTLRAAKDLGRKAIGIEIEERYCEIAARRMSQEVLALSDR